MSCEHAPIGQSNRAFGGEGKQNINDGTNQPTQTKQDRSPAAFATVAEKDQHQEKCKRKKSWGTYMQETRESFTNETEGKRNDNGIWIREEWIGK